MTESFSVRDEVDGVQAVNQPGGRCVSRLCRTAGR
jgi:hypothetical protein